MTRNKKRSIKDSGKDYEQMHKDHLIEWLKNDNAGPYKKGPSHSYNAIVYVRDPLVAMGCQQLTENITKSVISC